MSEHFALQPPYKVELGNPKKTILVEVMKATAAISVVEDYKLLGKLNLRELSMVGDDAVEDKATSSKQPKAEGAAEAVTTPLSAEPKGNLEVGEKLATVLQDPGSAPADKKDS